MKRHPALETIPAGPGGIRVSPLRHRAKRQYPLSGGRLAAVTRHMQAHGSENLPGIGRMTCSGDLTLLRPDRHRLLVLGPETHPCLVEPPEFDGARPVDIGDYWTGIEIRGDGLTAALRHVLPLPLPVGAVLRSGLDEIPVIAARPSETDAWLFVPRSFARAGFEHLTRHLPDKEIP
ncbi:hypothetical protein [Paracoccus methylarcula]|uniref:Sarcosine oxidase subunit gamma n=1 Tax=Paracoccus methylarcula TaxID=72022 RepID=A0A3R7LGJ7_9RHOB|nr:hypothetical protein [Paracoccus methylarcula]RNF33220.1 hypothetical protein A7A09_017455 [Paracoccus methylarcula]